MRTSTPDLDHCCKIPEMEQVGCGGGGRGLQAWTHSVPALGRGTQQAGEEQRGACALPKVTEGLVPLYHLQHTMHMFGSLTALVLLFWSHGGHGCSVAL